MRPQFMNFKTEFFYAADNCSSLMDFSCFLIKLKNIQAADIYTHKIVYCYLYMLCLVNEIFSLYVQFSQFFIQINPNK